MIVSTKSIVKLPFEGPVFQERLKLGEELLGRMGCLPTDFCLGSGSRCHRCRDGRLRPSRPLG